MDIAVGFGLLAAVLTVAALMAGLVERAPLSFPLLFLGIGLLLGDGMLGVIELAESDQGLTTIATLTLALVLFLDGVNLDLGGSRRDLLVPILALGPGTLLTALLIGGGAMVLLNFSFVPALLLGIILSSTDPVVLRDVLADQRVPSSVRRALKIEAGTNDVVVLPAVLILIAVLNRELSGAGDWLVFIGRVLLIGPVVGFIVGAVGSWLISAADRRLDIKREYQSLFGLGLVLGSYAAGVSLGGDGFLAAFAAGLAVTLLNRTLCDCFLEFGHATAEMVMLVSFVLFGALLSTMTRATSLMPAFLLGGFAIFVARPMVISTLFRLHSGALSRNARRFIAWFGPRGLNSLLFALLVLESGAPDAARLFATVGAVVVVSVVAHGTSGTPLVNRYARRIEQETSEEERSSTATELFQSSPDDAPRMSVAELARTLAEPNPPVVLDVRSRSQYARDDDQIPGSLRVHPSDLADWARVQTPDVPIALWCT